MNDYKKFGVDISSHQKGININNLKKSNVEFIIARAGYTGYGNGVSKNKDNQFENFYSECKKLNIPIGAYWYSCANTYEKGLEEAKYMYENCLKNKQFEYPIYIDVEDTHYQQKAGKKLVTDAIIGFCEYLEEKGYYVGIYANSNWFRNYIDRNRLTMYDKWLASWTKTKPTFMPFGMWQFGGETNLIRNKKIDGRVIDQDYSYKDYPKIIKNKKLNGFNETINNLKTLDEIAYEVIRGKYGNGAERKKLLTETGYNYQEVQKRVNEILRNKK